jgi:hypothetical protein
VPHIPISIGVSLYAQILQVLGIEILTILNPCNISGLRFIEVFELDYISCLYNLKLNAFSSPRTHYVDVG